MHRRRARARARGLRQGRQRNPAQAKLRPVLLLLRLRTAQVLHRGAHQHPRARLPRKIRARHRVLLRRHRQALRHLRSTDAAEYWLPLRCRLCWLLYDTGRRRSGRRVCSPYHAAEGFQPSRKTPNERFAKYGRVTIVLYNGTNREKSRETHLPAQCCSRFDFGSHINYPSCTLWYASVWNCIYENCRSSCSDRQVVKTYVYKSRASMCAVKQQQQTNNQVSDQFN